MKILGQNAHWIINKDIAKIVGIEGALLLSDLIDKEDYFTERGQLVNIKGEDFFFNTAENIAKDTTLSYKLQKKNIKILKENDLIFTELAGIPAKLHFKINTNKLLQMVNSSIAQKSILDMPKSQTNKNKEIIINNNNKIIKKNTHNYFPDSKINNIFISFIENRKQMKKPLTSLAINQNVKKINSWILSYGKKEVIDSIENSITNCYQGIFIKEKEKSFAKKEKEKMEYEKDTPDFSKLW